MASQPAPSNDSDPDYKKYGKPETWDAAADEYNNTVARSSRVAAVRLVELADALSPISSPDARVLDLATGTGAVAHALAAAHPTVPILATDLAPKMLEILLATDPAKSSSSEEEDSNNKKSLISTQVADMRAPLGGAITEGAFSHVFCSMAVQSVPEKTIGGVFADWLRLLKPDGIVAIGNWDLDEVCGPFSIWRDATTAVDPSYVDIPAIAPGYIAGSRKMREMFEAAGYQDVSFELLEVGFNLGKEGFMDFFWNSKHPVPAERIPTFNGDLSKVRVEMERLLDEKYDGGKKIPMYTGLLVGRKPKAG